MTDIIHVTADTFEAEVLNATVPVIVDFWAEWCQPCRAMGVMLNQLAAKRPDTLKIVKINTEEQQALAQRFNINGIPNLIVFRNGKVMGNILGFKPLGKLTAEVDTLLAKDDAQGLAPDAFNAAQAAAEKQASEKSQARAKKLTPYFNAAGHALNAARALAGTALMYYVPGPVGKIAGAVLLGTSAFGFYKAATYDADTQRKKLEIQTRALTGDTPDMAVLTIMRTQNNQAAGFAAANLAASATLVFNASALPASTLGTAVGIVFCVTNVIGLAGVVMSNRMIGNKLNPPVNTPA